MYFEGTTEKLHRKKPTKNPNSYIR